MAKVHKVEFYITDYNEEYDDEEDLIISLKEALYELHDLDLRVGVDHIKIQSSDSFDWDDDLKINKITASEEDFLSYFE